MVRRIAIDYLVQEYHTCRNETPVQVGYTGD